MAPHLVVFCNNIMMVYFYDIIYRRLQRDIAKEPSLVGCHCIHLS